MSRFTLALGGGAGFASRRNRFLSQLFLLLVAAGLALLLPGCGGQDETAASAVASSKDSQDDSGSSAQEKSAALSDTVTEGADGPLENLPETSTAGVLPKVAVDHSGHGTSMHSGMGVAHKTPTVAAMVAAPASVCFFENVGYAGRSTCASIGGTLMPATLDNKVSSVLVPDGLQVELFDLAGLAGSTLSLTQNVSNLATLAFNDRTSSFRITATGPVAPVSDTFYWSNPATWGGSKPVAGADVLVPAGMKLVLDESTPALRLLTIEGELSVRAALKADLIAAAIVVQGPGAALRAGSASARFTGTLAITLTDTNLAGDVTGMGMGTRGIIVHNGGQLQLFGNPPAVTWTRLGQDAPAAGRELRVAQSLAWPAGQRVVVAPTEWYPLDAWALQSQHDAYAGTELRTVSRTTGTTLLLSTGLTQFKWGSLQYMTDTGLSLSPGVFTKPHPDAASVIDERAEVGNLTRNIVIQGINDSVWRLKGFGAQVMIMDRSSVLQLDGVELRQVGQAGIQGRYPIHWHLLSYAADGTELGDATDHFVRNSSIWGSRQRCIVIHGTNGVTVRNNICYDIKGHAIFLEDGVERRNVIEENLVLRVRSPVDSLLVALHEQRATGGGCGGAASGLWLTNPDNTVRSNAVADAQGNGFWLSYPATPKKQNARVPLRPLNLAHGPFEFNSARANGLFGVALECAMVDDSGSTALTRYAPTVDGSVFNYTNGRRFELTALTLAKNRAGGYLNRTTTPDYRQFVVAGNLQRSITGAVEGGTFKHGLVVAASLNNRQTAPLSGLDPQLGIASYHSQMDISENTFSGFVNRGYVLTSNGWDKPSGTFGTDDYYIRPVEKGQARNLNNRLVGSDPGWRALPPHLQPNYTVASRNQWTLAGAIWDPYGMVAGAGRWWVLDHPFLRDASCTELRSVVPAGTLANGLSCAGPYYGVLDFWLNRNLPDATDRWGLLEKLVARRVSDAGQTLGQWTVEAGFDSRFIGHMRHFAAVKGGWYELSLPLFPNASATKRAPRWLQFHVENLREPGDQLLLSMPFDGATPVTRVLASTNPDFARVSGALQDSRLLSAAPTLSDLRTGPGHRYWKDNAGHRIWLKLQPLGLEAPFAGASPLSDLALYRRYAVRVE